MPDGSLHEEKLPESKTHYENSVGLRFQAEAARQAIGKGCFFLISKKKQEI